MAFIDENRFDEDALNPLNQQQQGVGAGAVGGANVTSGAGAGANPSSGSGPGGTGGWTNIQAYVDANKGGTGSSQALNKTVGGQFDSERNKFQTDSQNFLKGATDQVNQNRIDSGQADRLIDDASKNYVYQSGPKSPFEYAPQAGNTGKLTPKQPPSQESQPAYEPDRDAYNATVDKVRGALTKEFSGPREYNYGFSADTQDYGNQLKDQGGGFDQLMKHIYSGSAGSPLSGGQYALQKQLDVNNQSLVDSRKNLTDQYTKLGTDRDKTVQDTTAALGGLEQQYRTNQNELRDYLGRKANQYDQTIGQHEANARSTYQNDFNTGKTGEESIAMDFIADQDSKIQDNMSIPFRNKDAWATDLTWKQLQNEANFVDDKNQEFWGNASGSPLGDYMRTTLNPKREFRRDMLGNFYADQDQKYFNTADNEKRGYNAILDFLNSQDARKDQGFKVRG